MHANLARGADLRDRRQMAVATATSTITPAVPPMMPRVRIAWVDVRLGVLDVGSNTVHLLVVDAHRGGHPTPMTSEKTQLRLAEHLDRDGRITKGGADALVESVRRAQAAAAEAECDELLAFATSALRDAGNAAAVLRRVETETGVGLQVLSGEDEARYTFLAVRRWYGWSAGQLLVLDIGGGSLELAAGRDEDPDVAASLPPAQSGSPGAGSGPTRPPERRRGPWPRIWATRWNRWPGGCANGASSSRSSAPPRPSAPWLG